MADDSLFNSFLESDFTHGFDFDDTLFPELQSCWNDPSEVHSNSTIHTQVANSTAQTQTSSLLQAQPRDISQSEDCRGVHNHSAQPIPLQPHQSYPGQHTITAQPQFSNTAPAHAIGGNYTESGHGFDHRWTSFPDMRSRVEQSNIKAPTGLLFCSATALPTRDAKANSHLIFKTVEFDPRNSLNRSRPPRAAPKKMEKPKNRHAGPIANKRVDQEFRGDEYSKTGTTQHVHKPEELQHPGADSRIDTNQTKRLVEDSMGPRERHEVAKNCPKKRVRGNGLQSKLGEKLLEFDEMSIKKRPINAFMAFVSHMRSIRVQEGIAFENKDLLRDMAVVWRESTPEFKERYKNIASSLTETRNIEIIKEKGKDKMIPAVSLETLSVLPGLPHSFVWSPADPQKPCHFQSMNDCYMQNPSL